MQPILTVPSQVMSSTYTNRPEWQSLEDITGKSMKQVSRLEKHLRNAQVCIPQDSTIETGYKDHVLSKKN